MGRFRIGRIPTIMVFLVVVTLTPLSFENTFNGVESEGTISIVEEVKPVFNSFIENRGQLDREDIRYYTTGTARVGFTADRTVFVISGDGSESLSYEVRFRDCNPTIPEGIKPCSGVYNYLIGNREDWRTDVPHYSEVFYIDLWDGIDLRYHISGGFLKYDLILHPGADPDDISMEYAGIELVSIQNNGDLLIDTSLGQVWDKGLVAYQNGEEIPVEFSNSGGNTVSFDVGRYDSEDTLIIDPYLEFSTYFTYSTKIILEEAGSGLDDIYIAGTAKSVDFPTTPGAFDSTVEKNEAFVCRLKSDLSGFLFSTLIGGSEDDGLGDMVVDEDGNIYIGGSTVSLDFPTTSGALNETSNIWTYIGTPDPYDDRTYGDAFLTKMNSDGTDLIYSTYLGGHGSENVKHIDIDSSGNLYASGRVISTDFPLVNPYQDELLGNKDYFILKLNPQGSELVYSTYFGFNETFRHPEWDFDQITDIAVDDIDRVVFCGITDDEDFPVTEGVYNSSPGNDMGYLAMLYPNGSALEFCTFISSDMVIKCMALDGSDQVLIGGVMLEDSLDLPLSAVDKTFAGQLEGFVLSMDFNGTTLKYATYFGGDDVDNINDVAIDPSGNIWINGNTESTDLPITEDAYDDQITGGDDAYASCISGDLSTLVFSTYFGGSEGDSAKDIIVLNMNEFYIAGSTYSTDIPITPGAMEKNFTGEGLSTFISKIKVNSGIPSAPVNPYIVEGDGFINISWKKPVSTGNEEILNFSVYRSVDDDDFHLVSVVDAGIQWFNDMGLENGVIYYYQITASNIVGESPPSPSISGIPSTVPGNPILSVDIVGDSFINITWTDPIDDGGREIINYSVYIGPSENDLSPFEVPDNNWFNFTGLINGQTYYLGVSASNLLGEGSLSDLITAVPMSRPSEPLNLRAYPGDGFVHLYWDRPEDDGGESDLKYAVYDSEDNITFDLLEDGIESTDYNVTPFPSGDFKLFHVRAENPMGYSPPSDVAFSKSVARPSAPREFTVTMGDSSAYLRWQLPESLGGFDSVLYTVYIGNGPGDMEAHSTGISGVSYDIGGLTNGAPYYFAVSAVNPGGEGGWTEIIKGIPLGTPSKPLNLTAEPIDSGMVLRWDPPLDLGGLSRLTYVIFSGTNPENQAEIGTTASTKYAVSGLQNGLSYYFRVRGRSGDTEGDLSDLVSGIPLGLPGSPTNIAVTAGDGVLLISWDGPLDDGGSSSLRYRVVMIQLSTDSKITYDDIHINSMEINGLINGEEYSLFVLSSNEMGLSIPSNEILAVPLGPPAPPTSFNAIQIGRNIELRWSPPISDGGQDLLGYRIYRGTSEDDMRLLAEPGPADISYIDENTLEGVVYHYRITGYNKIGEGDSTSTISIEIADSSDTKSNDLMIVTFIMGSIIILLLIVLIYLMFVRRSEKISGLTDGIGPIEDQKRYAPTPVGLGSESNMTDEIEE